MEQAVIWFDTIDKLLGSEIRQYLFFKTFSLNAHVVIATTKYKITSIILVEYIYDYVTRNIE